MPLQNFPKGREVVFLLDGENVFTRLGEGLEGTQLRIPKLYFTDELVLRFNSTFEDLIQVKSSTLLNLLSGWTNGVIPSGQFAVQGLQVWKETDPLEFSLSVELHMVDSGREDVVKPALALSKLCLPSYGPGVNGKQGFFLVPPGPHMGTIISGLTSGSFTGQQVYGQESTGKSIGQGGGILTVKIGEYISLPAVVVTKSEPTFSNILDEEFMPVSCKIEMTFRTIEVASRLMITQIIKALGGGKFDNSASGRGITAIPATASSN